MSGPQPSRPLSWTSHSKSHDHNNLPPVRRASDDYSRSSSRTSSSASNLDDRGVDSLHDKERNWNRPNGRVPSNVLPSTPERVRNHYSNPSPPMGRDSPSQHQPRRLSTASLQSLNDGRFSRSSSLSSKSEYREQLREMEEERNKQREQQWNRPLQPRMRTVSGGSQHSLGERMRTYSTPSMPDSGASYLSPEGHRSRRPSMTSVNGPSRAGSPTSSIASSTVEKEQVTEMHREVRREREHNWNSPRPRWVHGTQKRAVSPSPTTAGSPSGIQFRVSTTSKHDLMDESFPGQSKMDLLADSLASSEIRDRTVSSPSRTITGMSRLPRLTPPRPKSEAADDFDWSRTASPPRFGQQFPRADFTSGRDSPDRPSSGLSYSSPPDRTNSTFKSHIPIRSPGRRPRTQSQTSQNPVQRDAQTSPTGEPERRREREREKRRGLIDFNEQLVSIPPPIQDQSEPESEAEHVPEPEPPSEPELPVVNVIHTQDEIHGKFASTYV